jgi:hypothetical protein
MATHLVHSLVGVGAALLVAMTAQAAEGDTVSPGASPRPLAKIVVAQNSAAIETSRAQLEPVRQMVRDGVVKVTGRSTPAEAWRSLVAPEQKVVLKVFSAPGPTGGTRLPVVQAVAEGLIDAGVPRTNITILDRRMSDLRAAGYPALAERLGVHLTGSQEAGYDKDVFYDNPIPGTLLYGDLEFRRGEEASGRRSHLTKAVLGADKIISIAPLLNNNDAGITGHLFSTALGCVDNTHRFDGRTDRLLSALPEIYGLPEIFDRVALNITDALLCQYQGESRSLLHYSVPLHQLWFSRDPVALDSFGLAELERQRDIAKMPRSEAPREIYANAELHELGVTNLKRVQVENTP